MLGIENSYAQSLEKLSNNVDGIVDYICKSISSILVTSELVFCFCTLPGATLVRMS